MRRDRVGQPTSYRLLLNLSLCPPRVVTLFCLLLPRSLQEQRAHADVVLSLDETYCPTRVQLSGTQLRLPPLSPATAEGGIRAERELLVLGLNPAVQRLLWFESPWRVGDVNRASAAVSGIGGKGQNLWYGGHNTRATPT